MKARPPKPTVRIGWFYPGKKALPEEPACRQAGPALRQAGRLPARLAANRIQGLREIPRSPCPCRKTSDPFNQEDDQNHKENSHQNADKVPSRLNRSNL